MAAYSLSCCCQATMNTLYWTMCFSLFLSVSPTLLFSRPFAIRNIRWSRHGLSGHQPTKQQQQPAAVLPSHCHSQAQSRRASARQPVHPSSHNVQTSPFCRAQSLFWRAEASQVHRELVETSPCLHYYQRARHAWRSGKRGELGTGGAKEDHRATTSQRSARQPSSRKPSPWKR